MKITKVIVHSDHRFPNPHEQFSNYGVGVTLEASISEGESAGAAVKHLRVMADSMLQEHREQLLTAREAKERSINGR